MTHAVPCSPFALAPDSNGRGLTTTAVAKVPARPQGHTVAVSPRRATQGPPVAESRETPLIDRFLEAIYDLAVLGDLQAATDQIFETVDRFLLQGAFSTCDEILRRVDVQRLPTALMRSFLTITAPAKDKLPARKAFYDTVLSEMIHLKGKEKAERLLGQLA
jgi:hypothetical protein